MELERFKMTVMPLSEKMQFFARSLLTNDVDAQDAVQETYLRLWNVRSQLDSHPNPLGFAMTILKNICIDKLRSDRQKVSLDDLQIAEVGVNPYMYTEQSDSVQLVRKIIDSLPTLQRTVMLMRDVEGYELNEIADIMGCQSEAVRVNLSRARKKVRDIYVNMNKIRQ